MYRPFPDDLPTLDECRRLLMRRAPGPPAETERVGLHKAAGRVLAEPVVAAEDVPPFDRATMDGFALSSRFVADASPGRGVSLPLRGGIAAGEQFPGRLEPGAAVEIATGARLPPGADAVVPVERCRLPGDGSVVVEQAVTPGDNVLPRGSDLQAGDVALAPGTRLTSAPVGVLAALGQIDVAVHPRPVVSIVTTGEELVPPEARPGPGQIRDVNTEALAAVLLRDGARVRRAGIVSDGPGELTDRLRREVEVADIVLVSGGSSVGKTDRTLDGLTALGTEILFHGLRLKPGKPTLFGLLEDRVLVGVPGNPVSALAVYHALLRPVLRRRMGVKDPWRTVTVRAELTGPIERTPEREELIRVRLSGADGRRWAEPVPGGSGMIHSMSRADGQFLMTLERPEHKAGDVVEVQLFD